MSVAKIRLVFLSMAALAATACGSNNNTAPTTPAQPAQAIVETFSGTVTPFSARTHVFTSNNAGSVIVQVTALDPPDTVVGLSLGTSDTFSCQTSLSTEQASLNSSLSGVTSAAGTLCAHIYDPSDAGFPGPVAYTLQVTHF